MKKKSKFYVFTLGCQMNVSDSQRITQKLIDDGYKSAPLEDADLVIVNACSVRQRAVDRIWGGIKKWQKANKKIFITGCVLPSDKRKLDTKNVVFFDIKKLNKLEYVLDNHSHIRTNVRKYHPDNLNQKPNGKSQITYIPIMTGCDNFCSYCAVPYTRGREKSRPMKAILKDIENALKSGSNNILLLGQNANSYKYGFAKLILTIDDLPYDFEFNFMSSNPHDMSEEIINTFAKLKHWPRELHLALQSGDDEILSKMNRKYTSNQFVKLVENLKSKIPNIKLTTDIIVGFPGETKTQFNNTVKIAKRIGFKKAYISQYSPRPGTAAARLHDNVSQIEKKRRWLVLEKLINK